VCFNVSTVECTRLTVSISYFCRYSNADVGVLCVLVNVSTLQWKSPGRLFRCLVIVDTAKSTKFKVFSNDVSTVECTRLTVSISYFCRYSKADVALNACFNDVSTVEISWPTVSMSCYCRYSKVDEV
jgi:hypothetical protein